jgi:hypothetical protein
MSLAALAANATPAPNSAVVITRIFDDCPFSTLNVTNNYPSEVTISDAKGAFPCGGFANLHNWRFSENGVDPAVFANEDAFFFSADLVIDGAAEAGLQISPWWSQTDGRFNVRSTDGEIACFGGRLPFYSFTAAKGVRYVPGNVAHVGIIYFPNSLTEANPATIEYRLTYDGTSYSSGPLKFDMGNPAENPPHGIWGILSPAQAGGYMQNHWFDGPAAAAHFTNIQFGTPSSVAIDVKPGSCDNSIGINSNGSGLSVVILGSADLDVSQIDVGSVRLQGAAAKKGTIGDVTDATTSSCDACSPLPADAYPDLTLKFMPSSVLAGLGALTSQDVELNLTASLTNGATIAGLDCAEVKGNIQGGGKPTEGILTLSAPNAPIQILQYAVPAPTQVRISVYSVTGRLVKDLVQGVQPEGTHSVSWDVSHAPSGMYFYRYEAGDHKETIKSIIVH